MNNFKKYINLILSYIIYKMVILIIGKCFFIREF